MDPDTLLHRHRCHTCHVMISVSQDMAQRFLDETHQQTFAFNTITVTLSSDRPPRHTIIYIKLAVVKKTWAESPDCTFCINVHHPEVAGSTSPLQGLRTVRSAIVFSTEGTHLHVPPQPVWISGGLSRTSWLPGNQVWVLLMLHISPPCISVTPCPSREQNCWLHQLDTFNPDVFAVTVHLCLIVRMQQLVLNLIVSALLFFAAMPSVYLQSGMSLPSSLLGFLSECLAHSSVSGYNLIYDVSFLDNFYPVMMKCPPGFSTSWKTTHYLWICCLSCWLTHTAYLLTHYTFTSCYDLIRLI